MDKSFTKRLPIHSACTAGFTPVYKGHSKLYSASPMTPLMCDWTEIEGLVREYQELYAVGVQVANSDESASQAVFARADAVFDQLWTNLSPHVSQQIGSRFATDPFDTLQ